MNLNDMVPHEDLMEMLTAVGDFQGARTVYRDITRMNLDDDSPHLCLHVIAALENDTSEMARLRRGGSRAGRSYSTRSSRNKQTQRPTWGTCAKPAS